MPASKDSTRNLGFKGERFAEKYLESKGYSILERNYYCRVGEIDIVAKDGDTLVFVEVKLRKSKKYGFPEEAVNKSKLKKIKKSGQYYIKERNLKVKKIRIDVVSLLFENKILVREKLIKGVSLW